MKSRPLFILFSALAIILLFSSCIDTDAKITIDKKGAGHIVLGYTVAAALLKTGELEANVAYPPFPVSREDFSRGIAGIAGLKLVSYSRKDSKAGASITADIGFDSPASLAAFLDPRGERAVWKNTDRKNTLTLTLAGGNPALDPDIAALLKEAAGKSSFVISFKLPASPVSSNLSGKMGEVKTTGVNTVYTVPLAEIATSGSPVVWEIVW